MAWIAEMMDPLHGMLYLSALLLYLGYARPAAEQRALRYGLCFASFLLSMASKPMAVSLPVAMLILDWFPLRRTDVKRILLEKAPFVLAAAAFALVRLRTTQATARIAPLAPPERLDTVVRAPVFYLWKWLWPSGPAPLYPLPLTPTVLGAPFYASVAVLLAISAACALLAKRDRLPLAAWLLSLGGLWICGLAAVTWRLLPIWQDDVSLWTREVQIYPGFAEGHNNRGVALIEAGRILEAVPEMQAANPYRPPPRGAR